MLFFAQVPVPDPMAITKQAEQFGPFVWFSSVVFVAGVFLIGLFIYFVARPWTQKAMGLIDKTGETLALVTTANAQQTEMMKLMIGTATGTAGRVDALYRGRMVDVVIYRKLADAAKINIDAELGRLAEITDTGSHRPLGL